MPRRIAPLGVLLIATGTLTIASAPQTRVGPLRGPEASSDISPPSAFSPFTRYFGGSKSDDARAIAMDSQGNVYMAGYTASRELLSTFPLQAARRSRLVLQVFPIWRSSILRVASSVVTSCLWPTSPPSPRSDSRLTMREASMRLVGMLRPEAFSPSES